MVGSQLLAVPMGEIHEETQFLEYPMACYRRRRADHDSFGHGIFDERGTVVDTIISPEVVAQDHIETRVRYSCQKVPWGTDKCVYIDSTTQTYELPVLRMDSTEAPNR